MGLQGLMFDWLAACEGQKLLMGQLVRALIGWLLAACQVWLLQLLLVAAVVCL
jgi:hypothetical protein